MDKTDTILQVFLNGAYEINELASDNRIFRINGKYLNKYKPILQEVYKNSFDEKQRTWHLD